MSGRKPYTRRVAYYETDQMGIVHHANYIRWFEEARDSYVRDYGIDYALVEAQGILMPVTAVTCKYKTPARYNEVVEIRVRLRHFNGVKLRYEYEITAPETGALVAAGTSEHCFIDAGSRFPVNLKHRMPEYSAALLRLLAEDIGLPEAGDESEGGQE